jgi:hypothetical protein
MATPLETFKSNYNSSQERQNSLKWQNATINDVAKKYGFNFSKDYANQQAEIGAAAQRNQYNAAKRLNQTTNMQTMKELDSNLKEGIVGTENNFFQGYLQQRQNQANRGLNAGMQADQDLRLGMKQQEVTAGLYRDTNNARSKEMDRFNNESLTIQEAMALVEKQKVAEAEKMYQDLITKGYGMLGTERSWYNTLDQQAYGKYQDEIDLYMQQQQLAEQAAARRAAQQRAQQAAIQQQQAMNKALTPYQDLLKGQSNQTPIQAYENTPVKNAVRNLVSSPSTSYATRNAFTNPIAKYAGSVAGDLALTPYDKMKMFMGERY